MMNKTSTVVYLAMAIIVLQLANLFVTKVVYNPTTNTITGKIGMSAPATKSSEAK